MARGMFFIDGFNVYHSLQVYDTTHKIHEFRKYLWLDFLSLARCFTRKQDLLSGLHYFTAYATWKPHSIKRHRVLIDALTSRGVQTVMGRFKDGTGSQFPGVHLLSGSEIVYILGRTPIPPWARSQHILST
jgi:hypothetical protein